MNIFNDIKEGILPDNNLIFYLLENEIMDTENKNEIEKHINILSSALNTATTQEKILLNRVLFVLERINGNKDYLNNFLIRSFIINSNEVDEEYKTFFEIFIKKLDVMECIEILNNQIKELNKLPSKELRNFFNWILHFLWHFSKYHNNNKFTNSYEDLKKLLISLRKSNRISDMMYVEFFTYHIMGNSFQKMEEWKEFNKNVTKETIKGYSQFMSSFPKLKNYHHKKKKIAFIKERIVFNSPYQVEYSLFKNLMENKEFKSNYELIVYTLNQFEKSFDDEKLIESLEDIGIKVKRPVDFFIKEGYYYNHLDKALSMRQAIIDDEIDIIIAGGVFPILNFLYITRAAPLQIYYSHGNCAYDVPNIDKRISHFEQECKEFEWNIINVPIDKQFLVGTDGEKMVAQIIKNDYKNKFGEDVVILGTIGRLIKIDSDEYIQTIAKIMKENPNTIYLACGDGNEESIKAKLKKYNIDENRFIFTGIVKPHVYGWVIDLWPDTFPLRQGQSKNEYIAKGGVVVFMEEYLNDTIRNWYKNSDINVCAKDTKDYIDLVSLYINDLEARKKVSEFNKTIFDEKINIQEVLKVFNV